MAHVKNTTSDAPYARPTTNVLFAKAKLQKFEANYWLLHFSLLNCLLKQFAMIYKFLAKGYRD